MDAVGVARSFFKDWKEKGGGIHVLASAGGTIKDRLFYAPFLDDCGGGEDGDDDGGGGGLVFFFFFFLRLRHDDEYDDPFNDTVYDDKKRWIDQRKQRQF